MPFPCLQGYAVPSKDAVMQYLADLRRLTQTAVMNCKLCLKLPVLDSYATLSAGQDALVPYKQFVALHLPQVAGESPRPAPAAARCCSRGGHGGEAQAIPSRRAAAPGLGRRGPRAARRGRRDMSSVLCGRRCAFKICCADTISLGDSLLFAL